MSMPSSPYALAAAGTVVYGLLAITGGVMGYVNKGSKPSLIAGGVSGSLLLISAAGMWYDKSWAALTALIVSFLLVGRFASSLARQRRTSTAILATLLGKIGLVMVLGG